MNSLITEDLAVIGAIDPDAFIAGEQLTAAIDMSKYEQVVAYLMLGDRVEGATVTFVAKSASASAGSYTTISGKSATAIADESPLTGASNKQVAINLRGAEVTDNNRYVKFSVTIAGSPSGVEYGVLVLGRARHRPADDNDLASVKEIIN